MRCWGEELEEEEQRRPAVAAMRSEEGRGWETSATPAASCPHRRPSSSFACCMPLLLLNPSKNDHARKNARGSVQEGREW